MNNDPTIQTPGQPPSVPTNQDEHTTNVLPTNIGEESTGFAPSFREPSPAVTTRQHQSVRWPSVGERLHDFELMGSLGQGAFAHVFLAREISLDRLVALKVSARRGNEARTLAKLEHQHIVQVFSQTIDADRDVLLLCMQYVAGPTLDRVMKELRNRDRATWSGQTVLDIIDSIKTRNESFDPTALRDRELLAGLDFEQTVCWLGARLAEGLAHAHRSRVLHRDIKPSNILINVYGRPLLADFNISGGGFSTEDRERELFGGTLSYMAPEHLDAFNPNDPTPEEAVDARSDVYSLGVVLFELLTGTSFHRTQDSGEGLTAYLKRLASERRSPAPLISEIGSSNHMLQYAIQRCLAPNPSERYQSATELAQSLDDARTWQQVQDALPTPGRLTRWAMAYPLVCTLLLVFLPHLLASVINITFNAVRIVGRLTEEQQSTFVFLVIGYNALVYPLCIWIGVKRLWPVVRTWNALGRWKAVPGATVSDFPEEVERARKWSLQLPFVGVLWSCLGWLPGGILFPALLHWLSGPVEEVVFLRFFASCSMSGLVALTYTVMGLQFVVLRVFYPRLWLKERSIRESAPLELRGQERRIRICQLLAATIPLVGALLAVGVGPEDFSSASFYGFRTLVTGMIVLGLIGLLVALAGGTSLNRTLTALTRRD